MNCILFKANPIVSFKFTKYSNFVVDKIDELPESSMKILHGMGI